MSERRTRHPEQEVWPAWKRVGLRALRMCLGFFLTEDGKKVSWSALALTALLVTEIYRLLPQDGPGEMRVVPILGWPEVFLLIAIIWGRWIDKAATTIAERNPDKIVDRIIPALISRLGVGDVAGGFSGLTGPANDGAPGGDLPG